MAAPYGKAILIGAVAGMRCFLAPAILAHKTKDGEIVKAPLTVAAVGELIGDKTPFIGNRTDAGPLIGRIISGAVCGAILSKRNSGHAAIGMIVGGAAAFASAHTCYLTHRKLTEITGTPDIFLALAEDTAAFALGNKAVKGI